MKKDPGSVHFIVPPASGLRPLLLFPSNLQRGYVPESPDGASDGPNKQRTTQEEPSRELWKQGGGGPQERRGCQSLDCTAKGKRESSFVVCGVDLPRLQSAFTDLMLGLAPATPVTQLKKKGIEKEYASTMSLLSYRRNTARGHDWGLVEAWARGGNVPITVVTAPLMGWSTKIYI